MTLDVRNDICKYYGSSMQNVRPLGSLEEDIFLWRSRASFKEAWRTFWIPEWSVDDFGCQKWHISILRKPCAKFKTFRCTGKGHSSLSFQSVLQVVLEDILDSWMECRWLWTSRMICIIIKEALCKIVGPSVHWKRIFSLTSPECPPRNLGGHSWFLNGV